MPKTAERDLEHCPKCNTHLKPEFLLAAAGVARQAMRLVRSGPPKIETPCPKCGELYGVAEMRRHKPHCNGVSLARGPRRPSAPRRPAKRPPQTRKD